MKKYFGLSILTLLVVGLMCGSAFAATSGQLNAGNATIASELVPATGLALAGVNTGYEVGGPVAATSQIKITLENGTFGATVINICDNIGGAYGGAVPTAGSTSVVITTTLALTTGNVYNFQPAACAAGPVPLTQISIGAGAVGGTVVNMVIDDNLNPGNTLVYAKAPIVTLVDQLSAVVTTPAASIIDFAAVPTMTAFKTTGATSTAKVTLLSNETIGTKIATGLASNTVCSTWPATAEALTFTATPGGTATTMGSGFHATTAFQNGATGTLFITKAAIASTDTSAAGSPTINGNMAAFACGSASTAATRTTAGNYIESVLTVNGTTALTARSYKLAVATKTSGAIVAAARTIMAATTAWTWSLDASQYYIPLVGSNAATGRETYIKVQSKSTMAGSNGVSVQILATDGTLVTYDAGTVTSGVPMTISGDQLAAAATAAGHPVDGQAGFAVIVTVNAPEDDVFAYANMIDAAGAKRVPVKTVGGANVE